MLNPTDNQINRDALLTATGRDLDAACEAVAGCDPRLPGEPDEALRARALAQLRLPPRSVVRGLDLIDRAAEQHGAWPLSLLDALWVAYCTLTGSQYDTALQLLDERGVPSERVTGYVEALRGSHARRFDVVPPDEQQDRAAARRESRAAAVADLQVMLGLVLYCAPLAYTSRQLQVAGQQAVVVSVFGLPVTVAYNWQYRTSRRAGAQVRRVDDRAGQLLDSRLLGDELLRQCADRHACQVAADVLLQAVQVASPLHLTARDLYCEVRDRLQGHLDDTLRHHEAWAART